MEELVWRRDGALAGGKAAREQIPRHISCCLRRLEAFVFSEELQKAATLAPATGAGQASSVTAPDFAKEIRPSRYGPTSAASVSPMMRHELIKTLREHRGSWGSRDMERSIPG